MSIIWTHCEVVESRPNVLSGVPVIRGTRIPVSTIFENMESGATIDELVEWFPGLTDGDVRNLLKFAAESSAA